MPIPTRSSVISSLKWQTLAKVLTQIISWTSTILVMRILSPGDYGLMAMATVVIGLVALISEMGIGSAIVQTEEIDTYRQRCLFGAALLLNSVFGLLLALSAPIIADFFTEPRLEQLIPLLALQLPLAALSTLPGAIAKRKMEFKTLSVIEMLSATICAIITLSSAVYGYGVWSLIFGQLAMAVSTPAMLLARFGTLWPALGHKGLERLITFGTTITLNRILWYFYSQADVLIAGKILGKELLGAYSVAVTLATLPMQKISAIVNQVAFSSFARIQSDKAAISNAAIKSIKLMGLISIPLLWGILSVAPELTAVILGEQWLIAVIPLQMIAFITPLRMISALISTMTLGIGNSKLDFSNTLILAVISIPIFLIGSILWGINGLALAWVISYPVSFTIILKRSLPSLQISITLFVQALKFPVLSGLLMVASVNLVRHFVIIEASYLLALEIIFGATTFIASSLFFDRSIYKKTISILKSK